jgi:phosphotriesterase-related protein
MDDITINTVNGTITPSQLGTVLMHEHPFVQLGGAGPDSLNPGPKRDAIVAVCLDHIDELREFGVTSIVDPTTFDLGRNIPLIVEIGEKTGFHIIPATGIYSTAAHLQLRSSIGNSVDAVAQWFIKEITEGIGDTGVRAGIIKVATTAPPIGEHEHLLLLAAARAAVETGVPITTHTEGVLGDVQQRILGEAGVPASRIIVGHSCGSTDFDYHQGILQGGSYLGFDRFGMENAIPDEVRVASLTKLLKAGWADRLFVSHDSVWYLGDSGPGATQNWQPGNFFTRIVPMLKSGGVTDEQIRTMLEVNPRRFFEGEAAPSGQAGLPAP